VLGSRAEIEKGKCESKAFLSVVETDERRIRIWIWIWIWILSTRCVGMCNEEC